MSRRALALVVAIMLQFGCTPSRRQPPTADEVLYIEVETTDQTQTAPGKISGVIADELQRRLSVANPSFRVTPRGGAPVTRVTYRLIAMLTQNDVATGPNGTTVKCSVKLTVAALPGRMLASGVSQAAMEYDGGGAVPALENCVRAATADVLVNHITPFLRLRLEALLAVEHSTTSASGYGFRVAVPVGWSVGTRSEASQSVQREGGVVLLGPDDAPIWSRLIIESAPAGSNLDIFSTDAECARFGNDMATHGMTPTATTWIEFPTGRSCQAFGTSKKQPDRIGSSTLLTAAPHQFIAVCTYGADDPLTPHLCEELLRTLIVAR